MARVAAKVANALGMNRFALNRGSAAGVNKGNVVDVMQQVDITDPDTNEVLGQAPAIVGQLTILAADEKFSIAAAAKGDQLFAGGKTSAQMAESLERASEVSINVE